jgi:hypothetical protein
VAKHRDAFHAVPDTHSRVHVREGHGRVEKVTGPGFGARDSGNEQEANRSGE